MFLRDPLNLDVMFHSNTLAHIRCILVCVISKKRKNTQGNGVCYELENFSRGPLN